MKHSVPIRLAVVSLATLLFALPVLAQDAATTPGTEQAPKVKPLDQARDLVEKIQGTDDELVALLEQLPEAEGEELTLLQSQIDDLARQTKDDLMNLSSIVLRKDSLGSQHEVLRQRVDQLMSRNSRRVRIYIVSLADRLEVEAARRSEIATRDLQVFEHAMATATHRLDRYYFGLIQLTDRMSLMRLDTTDELQFLERHLTERARNLLNLLELTSEQLKEFNTLLEQAPEDADLQARAFATEERYDANKTSLLATIQMLKSLGLDYTEFEVRALEVTGEITPEALQTEVIAGYFKRLAKRAKNNALQNGPKILVKLLFVALILLVFWLLARLVRKITERVLHNTKISASKLLEEMVISMAGRIVLAVGFIVVLGQLGIDLGPLLAGFGIAGIVIGFALQDTLANFASGAMILAYRPFDVGDFIEAAGVTGKVRDMNLVSTRILTFDNQTLIVPNSKIWGDVIRNVTAQSQRRVDMVFGISYDDDIRKAEAVLQQIVADHSKVLAEPEPMIRVHTLNESSVDFIVRPWVNTDDYWDVYWDITRTVKMRFDEESISIPFPQRDVHLIPADTEADDPEGTHP